jgi:hypothetical protein
MSGVERNVTEWTAIKIVLHGSLLCSINPRFSVGLCFSLQHRNGNALRMRAEPRAFLSPFLLVNINFIRCVQSNEKDMTPRERYTSTRDLLWIAVRDSASWKPRNYSARLVSRPGFERGISSVEYLKMRTWSHVLKDIIMDFLRVISLQSPGGR